MITPAQYEAWLRNPHAVRCVLADVQAYSGGQLVTRYASNLGYVSEPTDAQPNIVYAARIAGALEFRAELSAAFTGRSMASYGDLKFDNSDGKLDSWLDDAWDGRAVELWLGDPAWPRNDFQRILSGTADDIVATRRDELALKIRDKSRLLDVPVQRNLIGGASANKDDVVPLCFGPEFNVEPKLIDAATRTYQFHDGQAQAVAAVRENGSAVAFTADGADLAAGQFRLNQAAAGRITCDAQGAAPAGYGYLTKAADIVRYLVLERGELTAADIHTGSVAAFNLLCPQTIKLYVRGRENLIDVIDRVLQSVGGYWYLGRDGKMRLGRLDSPAAPPAIEIMEGDILEHELDVEDREIPLAIVRLGYAKNWTIQLDGLAGVVSDANRALYGSPHQIAKATNAGINVAHLLAPEPDVEETLLALQADAAAEATRRAVLRSVIRKRVGARVWAKPFSIDLGATVLVKHYRFGFPQGEFAIVVGLHERPLEGQVDLKLWK